MLEKAYIAVKRLKKANLVKGLEREVDSYREGLNLPRGYLNGRKQNIGRKGHSDDVSDRNDLPTFWCHILQPPGCGSSRPWYNMCYVQQYRGHDYLQLDFKAWSHQVPNSGRRPLLGQDYHRVPTRAIPSRAMGTCYLHYPRLVKQQHMILVQESCMIGYTKQSCWDHPEPWEHNSDPSLSTSQSTEPRRVVFKPWDLVLFDLLGLGLPWICYSLFFLLFGMEYISNPYPTTAFWKYVICLISQVHNCRGHTAFQKALPQPAKHCTLAGTVIESSKHHSTILSGQLLQDGGNIVGPVNSINKGPMLHFFGYELSSLI